MPREVRAETAESTTCLRRPMIEMEAPCLPNSSEIPYPIPDPPPVKRATFPFSISPWNGEEEEAAIEVVINLYSSLCSKILMARELVTAIYYYFIYKQCFAVKFGVFTYYTPTCYVSFATTHGCLHTHTYIYW